MKIAKRIVAILICGIALTDVKAAQGKYEPSPEELAELKKDLLKLEKDEKKFGRGTFGTLSSLQEVAGNYAALKDERCLDYIEKCYEVIRSIKGKMYFNIKDNNAWLVEPKYREAYYYYQIGNITKAQEKAKEALNICLNSRVDGDFKAQLMEKILTIVESFRDGEVLAYGAELESKLLESNSISGENINALKDAVRVNKINANNFTDDKKKRNNYVGKSFNEVRIENKDFKSDEVIDEQALKGQVPDFIKDYEKNPGMFFKSINNDNNKLIERDVRLLDVMTYYESNRNFAKIEEMINKFEEVYDSIESDSIEKVHFGEQFIEKSMNYFGWMGKYSNEKEFLEKWNVKISSDIKSLKAIEQQCWQSQYNMCRSAIASLTGDRASLDESVTKVISVNDAVSKYQGRPASLALVQIAGFYSSLGDHKKALEYYSNALNDMQKWQQSIENRKLSEDDLKPDNFRNLVYEWKASSDQLRETLLGILENAQLTGNWEQAFGAETSFIKSNKNYSKDEYDLDSDYEALSLLALNSVRSHDSNNALNIMGKIIAAKHENLENILQLPEDDLLSFQVKNYDPSVPAAILDPNKLFDVIVKQKGVVNDVIIKRNSAVSKIDPQDLRKIATLRSQLSQLALDRNSVSSKKQIDTIRASLLSLERNGAKILNLKSLQNQIDDICFDKVAKTLAPNQSYIEIFKYRPVCDNGFSNEVYAALIINFNSNKVARVELGGVSKINNLISGYNNALDSGLTNDFTSFNNDLYREVVEPLTKETSTNNIFFISPEDNFSFLPIAAIVSPDGKFVAESKNISYVATARDFVKDPICFPPYLRLSLFYNPNFDFTSADSQNPINSPFVNSDQFSKINLPPLPGTKEEASLIENIATNNSVSVTRYEGTNASENNFRSLFEQDIVHLGTHGFYLKSFHPPQQASRGFKIVSSQTDSNQNSNSISGVDPMRSSGIALLGAQKTLNYWANNIAPAPLNDGIVTAEEVAALNLNKTWLVTLSACETGRGESKSGEGVFGLRRAFFIAGVQNLLMTLWPVSDEVTPKIMADFYSDVFKTSDAAGSLAKVQRDWLVKLQKEKGLLPAVRDAGPFAMVVMANPNVMHPPDTITMSPSTLLNEHATNSTSSGASQDVLAECVQKTQAIMDQKIHQNDPSIQEVCTIRFKDYLRRGLHATKDDPVPFLNADFRYDTQDDYPKVNSTGPAVQIGHKISVPVKLQFGKNTPFTKSWVFVEENGTWLLDDVQTQKSGESSVKSMAGDLSKLPSLPESGSPTVQLSTSTSLAGSSSGSPAILEFADALAKADAGDAYAQGVVSIYYTMGYKVPKDTAKGLTYALKSAAQKNPLGIYQVGVLRVLGVGMKKDKAQGRKLISEAFDGLNAMNGDPYALYDLGLMALEGVGVDQNPKEAARLFKASADMGYAPAQRMFAKFLEAGVGVRKDLEAARQYQSQSSAQWSQQ